VRQQCLVPLVGYGALTMLGFVPDHADKVWCVCVGECACASESVCVRKLISINRGIVLAQLAGSLVGAGSCGIPH